MAKKEDMCSGCVTKDRVSEMQGAKPWIKFLITSLVTLALTVSGTSMWVVVASSAANSEQTTNIRLNSKAIEHNTKAIDALTLIVSEGRDEQTRILVDAVNKAIEGLGK